MDNKFYTQAEIAKMLNIPQCDVSQALIAGKVDPAAPVYRPYHYPLTEALNALGKLYVARKANVAKKMQKYEERIAAIIKMRDGENE